MIPGESKYRNANHELLLESIEKMADDWPNWNSDRSLSSHLYGDEKSAVDTDLVEIKEIIEDLGYSLNSKD